MLDPRLAHQSRARELTGEERALAAALEAAFATGAHDFDAVAQILETRGVTRPSGAAGPWTAAVLDAELAAINASLDDSYARAGIGP